MDIMKKAIVLLAILSLAFLFGCAKKEEPAAETEETAAGEAEVLAAQELTPKEELGRRLFFDTRLSEPMGQACAVCHGPTVGWTGPDEELNKAGSVYPGALEPRFGNRKPPTSAYAGASPKLHRDEEGTFVGGMFWDGRATGWTLGDPLAEQAMGPFLNPLEQNMPDNKAIIQKVIDSDYADLFREVWGVDSLDIEDPEATYANIGRSIAAYERSSDVTKFTSKFDDFWRKATKAGLDVTSIDESNVDGFQNLGLNEDELQGLVLFNTTGLCAQCHVLDSIDGNPPLFTDFTYDNLGVPRNPDNPFYAMDKEWNPDGENWVDKGLGGFLETTEEYQQYAEENMGKQKVPTLRNVDLRPFDGFVKAFTHNGFFKSLKVVVNFYNTRDKEGASWPPPEIAANVNVDEMGDLGLTPEEEDLIVLFMTTLSDR
jgi:cytochrome c peroxidase